MDTTVILAQPRGSRLRAAAGYVVWLAPPGAAEDRCIRIGESRRGDPPNRGIRIGRFDANFSPIQILDLGAQAAPRCPCAYRGVENAKNSYWYLEPLCLWLLDTESQLRIVEKTLTSAKKRSQNALRPTDLKRAMEYKRLLLDIPTPFFGGRRSKDSNGKRRSTVRPTRARTEPD